MSKAPIRKRKTRRVKMPGEMSATERLHRSASQFITGSPYYQQIIKAIRQGVPNSQIASFFIDRGIFDVNQKTAVSYLQSFRRQHPEICKPRSKGTSETDLDNLFDGNFLMADPETELLRLIALQKARLGIAFQNERQINVVMNGNRREVEELRNLIMELAKLRGMVGDRLDVNLTQYNESVKDDLRGIKQDEGQRNLIATLVSDLVKA